MKFFLSPPTFWGVFLGKIENFSQKTPPLNSYFDSINMGVNSLSVGRDFQSYLDEYLLQTTEAEINAFWKRMDVVMKKMPLTEKTQFFNDLIKGIDESVEDSKMLRDVYKRQHRARVHCRLLAGRTIPMQTAMKSK